MACEVCSNNDEIRSATRRLNRALRSVNHSLRRKEALVQEQTDAKILALMESIEPSPAEEHLAELFKQVREKAHKEFEETGVFPSSVTLEVQTVWLNQPTLAQDEPKA